MLNLTRRKAAIFGQAVCAFLFLAVPAAYAQEAAFDIKKPSVPIILATPFKLEIEAVYPEGISVKPDTAAVSSQSFEITGISAAKPRPKDGKSSQVFTLTVVPFELGTATFPALGWIAGGQTAATKSPELPLEVLPFIAKPEERNSLVDIRPPYRPFNYWPFVIAMLIAAGLGILLWRRKEAAALAAAEAADTRPPETKAFDALNELLASGLWEQEKYKQFYNQLADIMRDYITVRMNAGAHQLTTADLLRELKKRGRDKLEVASLRKFFGSCDLVKFAKHIPVSSERNSDMELLKLIITQAAPKPEPTQTAEAAAKQ